MNLVTKQGFKIVGILPYVMGKNLQHDKTEFNKMQAELKIEYPNNRVLFDRDIENDRIVFFIC